VQVGDDELLTVVRIDAPQPKWQPSPIVAGEIRVNCALCSTAICLVTALLSAIDSPTGRLPTSHRRGQADRFPDLS